ncbi:hypothetical protein CEE44_04095 [Candidatus Woesearchaeota archaeon B3_Woes]|nr:MAG: hypothetical protein CEE44_04095 [Candidatus Woesearchaeota archaeon B3_Woes]
MYNKLLINFKKRFSSIPIIAGSTTIVKFQDFFIFAINKSKYWKKRNNMTQIGFSCVGGRIEQKESPLRAALREVKEEILQEIKIMPLKDTTHIKENNEKGILKIKDGPAYVVEFISPGMPGDPNKDGKWGLLLFIFIGEIKKEPFHSDEIPGIIFVKKDNFDILYKESITYSELNNNGNFIKSNETIPEDAIFKPTFSGKIISKLKINPTKLFENGKDN